MSDIKTVGLLAPTGNVGAPTLKALLSAGFTVTAITRPSSNFTAPPGVTHKTADWNSIESLAAAFSGLDAVIAALNPEHVTDLNVLADAALKAGVKRYIPGEFGHDNRFTKGSPVEFFLKSKIVHLDYVKKLAAENPEFSWSALSNGVFFEWGWKVANYFDINEEKQTIEVVDSGTERFPTTTLSDVAGALAVIVQHPQETKNRYLTVHSFEISRLDVAAAYEKVTGKKLTVIHTSAKDYPIPDVSVSAAGNFLQNSKVWTSADGAGKLNPKGDSINELFGFPTRDLAETIKEFGLV